ncbi:MAG TPA: DUF2330 domain-containing protein [Acidimicrobiales bacterium]
MLRRLGGFAATTITILVASATAAAACGFLISPNGAVQLRRTATLAAYVDGVEHYVTSFEFGTAEESFGSIIPLPDVPTKVEKAGGWTLQRLARETQPQDVFGASADFATAGAAREAEVLLEVRVDSLDITVLKGGPDEVVTWAESNGFFLPPETGGMLDFYARRSPIFMAAKFDAAAATAEGFTAGDGVPIHVEIPTDNPWVPINILTLAKPAEEIVAADVYLLTDGPPSYLAGDAIFEEYSEPASQLLLDDLRGDENSEWIPEEAWLTYLRVDGPAADLHYDLAIDAAGGIPAFVDTGRPFATSLAGLSGWLHHAGDTSSGTTGLAVALAAAGVIGVLVLTRPALRLARRDS